ncbi:MAG TPA: MarR family transcriptional regulator [Alphaproteobacteria bacterium]|nr:MarR family transcriptional regulator [Alphaproteobacteria bacterium]
MVEPKVTAKVTPESCARDIMETIPVVMRFIRGEMRRQRTRSLSVPQFRALVFLSRHPGASLSSVADYLGVTRPTTSVLVERLVRRGLVTRTAHPEERRRIVLALTPTGAHELQRARDVARNRIAAVLAGLSPMELCHISAGMMLLERVFKNASPQDGS